MVPKIYRKLKVMPVIEYSPWAVLGILVWKLPDIIRACSDCYVAIHSIRQEKQAKEKTPPDN